MTTSTRLYGTSLEAWKGEPYEAVLIKKLVLGNILLSRLVLHGDMEDHRRMNEVIKASTFNRELLYELGYDDMTISKKIKESNNEF